MIRKLRKKFIMISTFSVIAVLVFVLGGINMVNYYNARVEIFSVLTMISESGGVVPETLYYRSIFGEAILTQETVYSLRFFSAYVAEDDSGSRFFTLWTRKEAYSKYTGLGMEQIMKKEPVPDDREVLFTDLRLEDGCYCSICSERIEEGGQKPDEIQISYRK